MFRLAYLCFAFVVGGGIDVAVLIVAVGKGAFDEDDVVAEGVAPPLLLVVMGVAAGARWGFNRSMLL